MPNGQIVGPQEIGESFSQAAQPERDFQMTIEQQLAKINFDEKNGS